MSLSRIGGLQALADLAQQFVAGGVAQGIVDRLEAVEIEPQHRQGMRLAAGQPQRLLQPVPEQGPIGQFCQRVKMGQFPVLLLAQPAVGDVVQDHDGARTVAPS